MGCPCNSIQIITPPSTCNDCLVAKTIRYGCDNAPDPCGESVSIDLSAINNVNACKNCVATYSIKKFDEIGFSSVTVTSEGVLTYTTSSDFEKHKEYEITYKIVCPCGSPQLSTTAKVYVCKKDLCKTAPAGSKCNKCNGQYINAKSFTIRAADSLVTKCSVSSPGTVSLSSYVEKTIPGSVTYSVVSATSGLTGVSVNASTGVLSFSRSGSGWTTQSVVWAITGSGMRAEATLNMEVKNLCDGVACNSNQVCNECTGICESASVDLEIV